MPTFYDEDGVYGQGVNCAGFAVSAAFGKHYMISTGGWKPTAIPGESDYEEFSSTSFLIEPPNVSTYPYFNSTDVSSWDKEDIIAEVEAGDIVGWTHDHYVYVHAIINGEANLAQVLSINDPVVRGGDLGTAIDSRGIPNTVYKTIKAFKVTATTNGGVGAVVKQDGTIDATVVKDKKWGKESISLAEQMHDNTVNGVYYQFLEWAAEVDVIKHYSGFKNNHSFTNKLHHYNRDAHFTAKYIQSYKITLKNSLVVPGNIGTMTVNDTVRTLPLARPFLSTISQVLRLTAMDPVEINGIRYEFDHWSWNNSTSKTITLTPSAAMTITAYFKGIPTVVSNLTSPSTVGQMIKLTWTAHTNSNCSYEVWRYKKDQFHPENNSTDKLATLTHNIITWTDPDFKKTSGYSNYLLKYDVRALYTVENTTADPDFRCSTFGNYSLWSVNGNDSSQIALKNGSDHESTKALEIYPNPFNPVTTVRFYLAEGSRVSAVIYNIQGRKVIDLIKEYKPAGSYSLTWNGRDRNGAVMASGIYLLHFQGGDKQFVRRLVLMK